MFKLKSGHSPDYIFLICVWLIVIFGIIMLSSASSDLGKIRFNDTYYFLKHQIFFGLSFGIIGFFITSKIYYKNLEKIAPLVFILSIFALILIFSPIGETHNKGASRWLDIGPLSIQPTEFLKLTFIVYLSAWLSNRKVDRHSNFLKGFLPFSFFSGITAFLILIQPATTTMLIIMSAALIIYFVSGAKWSYILGIFIIGIFSLSAIIYLTADYRYNRIMSFLSSDSQTKTIGYQVDQTKTAIGSGGFWGVGFGKSIAKYKYIPESIGDSIFAVIAQELGFIGALILISSYFTLIMRGFFIAKKISDKFGKLITIGFITIIGFQAFIHIAAVSGLIPLTGVPLPFISYGGTSLVVFLTMAGIIVNISKHT